MKKVYVINPNSNVHVTQAMDKALDPLRRSDDFPIECVTLSDGPPGIATQQDVDFAAVLVCQFAQRHQEQASCFITACFSDPGLHALREIQGVPGYGISECAMLTALTLGQHVGVIAMAQGSIARHYRKWGEMGIQTRMAGEVPINRSVAALSDEAETKAAMILAATRLRDEYHADVLVMGCAGMASYRDAVEQAVGVPVVEPTQAAVAMALGRLQLGW